MRRPGHRLFGAIVGACVLLVTTVAAVAETCTLKIKRRETKPAIYDQTSYMYWTVQPQYFFMQMIADGDGKWRAAGQTDRAEAFKRIVRKEPKYVSEHPYRGVVKLGTQEFAFALDVVPSPDAKKTETPDAKKPEAKTTEKTAKKSSTLITAITEAIAGVSTSSEPSAAANRPAKPVPIKDFAYNRLYFDFNHNGDLSDDKVVEITPNSRQAGMSMSPEMSYLPFEFPRIDLAISLDGTKLDYSLHVNGYANSYANNCNVMVSFSSATCREGDIALEGKQHHLVLIDFNSNGRFNDKIKLSENIHLASGQVYAEMGDVLLVDPQPGRSANESPYDPTTSDYRHYLSEKIQIDGRWYDLKISPTGDQLTLTPSTVALGNVKNRNDSFGALIYSGDKGFLKIRGTKDKPISIPEGQWKLYSYSISKETPKPVDKKAEASPKAGSLLQGLAASLGGGPSTPFVWPSNVSATATDKYDPVTVRKGETVEMPFGPPYKPTVTTASYGTPAGQPQQTYLEMTLIGVGGEAVTNMTVKGSRPGKPEFTITDPQGKVVQQGSFEYG
jgi:hypothetical protein